MFDIITFGSATQDILVKARKLTVLKYKKEFASDQNFVFPVGSKVDVDDINFSTGGGGTNTAATFSLQGFKTAFCGMVGKDNAGKEIFEELKALKVDTKLVFSTSKKLTNHSIIILKDAHDRTILAYRGASELLGEKDILWKSLKAKWFYLAPLSGLLCDMFEDIVDFAHKNKIKVSVNPGVSQLSLPMEEIRRIFKKIDVLFLNQEEASFLTKVPYQKEKEIFNKVDLICPGIVVMTKGDKGAAVSDGKYLYSAKPHVEKKIVDTTGAGDAFGSGFVAEFMRSGNIEESIQLSMANALACISQIGAKNGLLKKGQKFKRVNVSKTELYEKP